MDTQNKDQLAGEANKQLGNINIDINGDGDQDTTKNTTMNLDSERVGLSKDELMKFANQPYWVRLRNILFASFWIVWVSILIAAIGYVIHSPGCTKMVSASTVPAAASTPAVPNS